MSETIDTIRTDHQNFRRVLEALQSVIDNLGYPPTRRELDIMYSAVYYMRVFPDRHHHPKEERYVLAALRDACPDCGSLLSDIEKEHAQSVEILKQIEALLEGLEKGASQDIKPLQAIVREYVRQQGQHMRREERELLPLAEQHLSMSDWERINAAFRSDRDPLFQDRIDQGFDAMAQRLVDMADDLRRTGPPAI